MTATTQTRPTASKVYKAPGEPDSLVEVKPRYENFIGGRWVAPVKAQYMKDLSPTNAAQFTEVPRSTAEDIEVALDAAHAAKQAWGETSLTERAKVLNRIADAIEDNLEMLAVAETWDNGKPVRETLGADIPLSADHFRYFAGETRALQGSSTEIDKDTVAYHFHEPLGVVGQIIPFNFPLLMAAWKIAPALAGGNCTVIKPASSTPWSILKLAEVIGDIVPPGVLNIVTGPGGEIGKALAANPRISKIAFTGETVTGRLIMQYAAENIIPSTTELGGKSPNIFFADVMDADDEFLDKAVEGLVLYAFNKGEVCTCPSRALIQESIYDRFMERCLARIAAIRQGNPLDISTQVGPQNSKQQLDKIASYVDIGLGEGAECLIGGKQPQLDGELANGYFFEPTVLKGHNKMRVFQEEIFGPVLAVTTFKDEAEAIEIANDTLYGLGAGVWTRNGTLAYKMGRAIQAGRVWTNCYHMYPAGAAFGGYKMSGVGRELYKETLTEHYTQTKNLLVSYSNAAQGLF
ncbi:aldehyde dehydrogenase [Mycobacterium malmoense]|uniref:Aldehyde dehydrogenase n=1 Tax=Mycobacterium malmoense TaxID=1780 RepID=A0ABX3ST45_MYCMA|nr:aldehyde dehydrogenase family protein [Mycobacterium malmoense]ORA83685.1 aldehyde dehydrogenase [Mycobacterium malmoense]QZA18801.1 aldehyde dehydrogenase [Mycobacterium malmoense]UNB95571.1 aldehyde dehydrogenase [Mycobacterium malmoense]